MVRDHGLTVPQLLCMRAIEQLEHGNHEVTVARVSETVQLSAATVSRILERLVRAGLVLRERGTKDRRKVALSLTEQGKGRLERLPTPLQDQFVRRLAELPDEQRRELLTQLQCVVTMMEAEHFDVEPVLSSDPDPAS
ncbi:MarR family winged helix-turn-helix transcriptional regulator [Nannocystaceae bacterium ST9]